MEHNLASLYSLSSEVWQQVLASCYYCLRNLGISTGKRYDELFRPFCALKSTSKHFNQLFGDEFFYGAISRHNLRSLKAGFARKRIHHIIKNGNFRELKIFLDVGAKWQRGELLDRIAQGALPLIAQHSDPSFMRSFLALFICQFNIRVAIAAVKCANDRRDENSTPMTILLLPKLVPSWNLLEARDAKKILLDALSSGKKFHFDKVAGFTERFVLQPTIAPLLECLVEKPPLKKLVVPDGNLIHFTKLGSKNELNKGFTNLYLKKKNASCTTLIYRDRDSTQHEISLPTDGITKYGSDIYSFEGTETDNLNELIVNTSLHEKIFNTYPHQLVAVTEEVLNMPLEEQPWFLGNISDVEKAAVASEAPNRSIFFTYSHGGRIFLVWAETIASRQKFICSSYQSHGVNGDIRDMFPKDKFIMGLYNSEKPKDVIIHWAYKFVMQGDLEKTKQTCRDNNINVAVAYKTPNVLSQYIKDTPKSLINNDLIIWLVEQGAPIENQHLLITVAIEKCQEKTISAILKASRECSPETLRLFFQNGASYELMREVYTVYKLSNYQKEPLISDFLVEATPRRKKFKVETYTNRVLIMLAWNFGNDDNYFKMLPPEIIHRILGCENIDEPVYFEFLEFLMETFGLIAVEYIRAWKIQSVARFLPFFWKHWDKYFNAKVAHDLVVFISDCNFMANPNLLKTELGSTLRYWYKRILSSEKFTMPFELDAQNPWLSLMTQYCLSTPTEEAMSMLKFLLRRGITTKERLLRPIATSSSAFPGTWLAVSKSNLPMISFLVEENLLPESFVDSEGNTWKLEDVFSHNPKMMMIRISLTEYIAKSREALKNKLLWSNQH